MRKTALVCGCCWTKSLLPYELKPNYDEETCRKLTVEEGKSEVKGGKQEPTVVEIWTGAQKCYVCAACQRQDHQRERGPLNCITCHTYRSDFWII